MSSLELARQLYLLLAALGLNVALGYAGQPVLGQGAFVAVGSYGAALLTARAHWPLGVAVVAAVAVAGLLGWLVAFGAARLRGPFLALATWSLAWLVFALVLAFPGVFGGGQGLVRAAPAHLVSPALGLDWALTPRWHVLIAAVLCAAVGGWTHVVGRGPVGLDLAAVRESSVVADSLGVRVAAARRGALAIAAAVGALAGAGTTVLQGVVAPADLSPLLSIQLFAVVLIGGTARAWGPAVGVAVLAVMPAAADALSRAGDFDVERSRGLLTALLLVGVLALRPRLDRRLAGRPAWRRRAGSGRATDAAAPRVQPGPAGPVVLAGRGLIRCFGAVRAVDGVSIEVRDGEIHALVGPNGSGKSTVLRLLSGALHADAGAVVLDGRDVTRVGQADRVRLGVARTFQRTGLFPRLTVGEQILVGTGARRPVSALRDLFGTPTAQLARAAARSQAIEAARLAGLRATDAASAARRANGTASDRLPASGAAPEELPYGEQRLLQIARAVATGARVLLLDEPSAGMSVAERARLAATLRSLANGGRAVLLVEHDMRLVAALADRITVLAEGRVLASGPPAEVLADPAVRTAYLGAAATD